MKKILLSSMLVCSLFANEENYIELGLGFSNSKDNFSAESDKKTSRLSTAKSESGAFPFVSFYYGNNLDETLKVYVQSFAKELRVGLEKDLSKGTLDFGLKGNLINDEEWENPFLTNQNRKETNTSEYGFYLGYTLPISEFFESSLTYEYSQKNYDKEDVISVLKREGDRHIVSLEHKYLTRIFNKQSAILSNISYEKYEADGEASSYDIFGLEVGVSTKLTEDIRFSLFGEYSKKDYDKYNPIVDKKVDADIYGATMQLRFEEPFNYKNVYTTFTAKYEDENANVDFYDKENTYGIISVGYKF